MYLSGFCLSVGNSFSFYSLCLFCLNSVQLTDPLVSGILLKRVVGEIDLRLWYG
jgi:hypothetical protein